MQSKIRKLIAMLLVTVMVVQQGSAVVTATDGVPETTAETSTEPAAQEPPKETQPPEEKPPETQAPTEAPQTEPATQAPTEPPQTEPVTQAPTEAPQTEPATQAPTEAPQTELATQAPTEAPQTEPSTQAPTEPPQTEPLTQEPTEAPQTEPSTQEPTEKETPAGTEAERPNEPNPPAPPVPELPTESETETETEAQTDVKDRQNDGTRIRVSVVKDGLIDALPYLIVAGEAAGIEYEAPELEETAGAQTADEGSPERETEALSEEEETEAEAEEAGGQIAAGDVLVGTEASDILGMLAGFSKELANGSATRTVKVVNLYADEDGGIDNKRLKEALAVKLPNVEDELAVVNIIAASAKQKLSFSGYDVYGAEDAGKVLYNFAAFEYVNENKIKFVDYKGTVTLTNEAGLKGTWLAPSATVNIGSDLTGAVYANTVNISGSPTLTKAELAGEAQEETDLSAETQTEPGTESEPESEIESESETESEPEPETESEPVSENTEETDESETELLTETETELPETEAMQMEELGLLDEAGAMAAADGLSDVALTVHVLNGTDNTPAAGIKISVKAGADIVDSEGKIVHMKDALITEFESTAEGVPVGSYLTNGGSYYLEADVSQTEYLPGARVYFHVNAAGNVQVGAGSETPITELNYYVQQFADGSSVPGGLLVVEAPSGTTFVVKDRDKKVLADAAGYPLYYMTIPGTSTGRAAVTLPAGTYWLSQLTVAQGCVPAADQEVVIGAGTGEGKLVSVVNAPVSEEDSNTLHLTVKTLYGKTLLTAESEIGIYAALFADQELTQRITGVQKITQAAGATASDNAVFYLQGAVSCYLSETDEFGTPVPAASRKGTVMDGEEKAELQQLSYTAEAGEDLTAVLQRDYSVSAYPNGLFSYTAEISITKTVLLNNTDKKTQAVTDKFYISLFKDPDHKELEQTVTVSLENADTKTETVKKKMTAGKVTYYAAETNASGVPVQKTGNGAYNYKSSSFEGTIKGGTDTKGRLDVICGSQPKLTVTNVLGNATVKFRVVDESGKHLSGAELVFRNANGSTLKINNEIIYRSKNEDSTCTWDNAKAGSYYLSEIKAPSGYMPAVDAEFTIVPGMAAEVQLVNATAKGSGKATVGVQIYEGTNQLYAQDTSSGQYAAKGDYTRYIALFLDSACKQKATNVQALTISGFTGSTTFEHLEEGRTYYVAETTQYGQVRTSNNTRAITYTDDGRVLASSSNTQAVVTENYTSLPEGFRYSARLTIEKRVVDSSDNPKAVSESFYVGIFRNADYSDTPTVVRLDLNNAASATVTRRILLSGSSSVTYYFAEVNASGQRVENSAEFKYTSSIDKAQVTLSKSADEKIVVTNKDRISKVTLYLTKRVYRGSTLQNVNATFYAGLFRDAEFTKMYADPIPLNIKNNSSVTLKLSLNLGAASEATIYVAEVDKNGKVVQSGASFGYDTRVVNSTVHFTQEATEVQSIILNTVAGTTSDDDWQDIYSSSENNVGGGNSYSDYISDNGSASSGTASSGSDSGSSSVQTADNTPWAAYLVLMIVSGMVFAVESRKRRRIRK